MLFNEIEKLKFDSPAALLKLSLIEIYIKKKKKLEFDFPGAILKLSLLEISYS